MAVGKVDQFEDQNWARWFRVDIADHTTGHLSDVDMKRDFMLSWELEDGVHARNI